MAYEKPQRPEKVYVKVNSDFDSTGYMQPRSITWKDGRVFQIEAVKDFRPASSLPVDFRETATPCLSKAN